MSINPGQAAGPLRKTWIAVLVLGATFYISWCLYWRARCNSYQRHIADRHLRCWSRRVFRSFRVIPQVFNPSAVVLEPGKRYILMSNHTSLFDIPAIYQCFDGSSIRMISKKELFDIPIFGKASLGSEMIAIDRDNREQAIKDLQLARQAMESGVVLWVAPEGTRSRDGRLLAFKKGAFRLAIETGATIIPIGIRGLHRVLPAKTLDLHYGGQVEIHIGSPVDASQFSLTERQRLAEAVRSQMLELVGPEQQPLISK